MPLSRRVLLACGALAPAMAACTSRPSPDASPTATGSASSSPSPAPSVSPTPSAASTSSPATAPSSPSPAPASSASPAELAGRCLMVGLNPQDDAQEVAELVTRHRLAGVFLLGHWDSLETIRATTARIHRAARAAGAPRAILAADQEGGLVQNLTAPAFTAIPSAERLGAGDPADCTAWTRTAGTEMVQSGLNLVLAPVADVVDPRLGTDNAPIGALHRGYGTDPATVSRFVAAAVSGFHQGGVATSVKHFPGLGAVRANTDLSVATDTTTTTASASLAGFRAGIVAGSQTVMVSSAIYSRIDPSVPAVFSSTVVTDLLRTRLGFSGVVVSDDLGAAKAVAAVPVGRRAVRFVAAGGDLVLCADPSLVPQMVEGLEAEAGQESFAQALGAAAGRVDALVSRLRG